MQNQSNEAIIALLDGRYPAFEKFWLNWRDPADNLRKRLEMRQRAVTDGGYRRELLHLCEVDTLFFFSAFCWLFEPRPTPKVLPFFPWPHQIPAIITMDENWGSSDVLWDKSRGEGATWMVLTRMLKDWLFVPLFAGGLASRNIQSVDRKDDPDCLMWKLDWQLGNLPKWMQPRARRVFGDEHLLVNQENRAPLAEYAATEDLGTGGRKSVWLWDEMSKFPVGKDTDALNSTEPTTNCRMMVSTHKGTRCEYYRIIRRESDTPKIILDWVDNPTRNKGLFRLAKGLPVGVDSDVYGPVPADLLEDWEKISQDLWDRGYEWNEEKLLSQWYIERCLRDGMTPHGMAQEYDRNPEGTEHQFFSDARVRKIKSQSEYTPFGRYALEVDADFQGRLIDNPKGPLRLWCELDYRGRPAINNPVVFGCDISQGTAGDMSSNSVCAIIDKVTGEQIGEYVTKEEDPGEFGETVMALGNLFEKHERRPFLNWEHDGAVGKRFWKKINEIHYAHIFMRYKEDRRGKQKSRQPGTLSQTSKENTLSELRTAYYKGDFVLRSSEGHEELLRFIYDESGNVIHSDEKTTEDLTARGKSHGDRPIAYAVAWLAVQDRPNKQKKQEKVAPKGSVAYRSNQRKKKKPKSLWA